MDGAAAAAGVEPDMAFQFAVLGSGSRGNATLIGPGSGPGLLIDLGLGPRTMAERLAHVGSGWNRIGCVLLTHTHGDHVGPAALGTLSRLGIPLYCHEAHLPTLTQLEGYPKLIQQDLIRTFDGRPFLTPGGLRVEPIAAHHDAGPTFGFRVEGISRPRSRPWGVGYLADTGSWTNAMAESLADVNVLSVEFNHDVELQRASNRPAPLIARNLGDRGHLSNAQAAELVRAVLSRSRSDRLEHLVLLHLSEECNHPELALREAQAAIATAGGRIQVHAAASSPAFPNLHVGGRLTRDRKGPSRSAASRPRSSRIRPAPSSSFLPGLCSDLP